MINYDEIANNSRASIEHEDLKILLPIVAKILPEKILEIGADQGYSAKTWIEAFHPTSFITLELDATKDHYSNFEYNFWYGVDSHAQDVLRDVKLYLPTIDFLFIDGDHSLEGVKQDFEMYSPLVKKGGIIAFHDACYHSDKSVEVDIFWNEIKKQYPYVEIKSTRFSTGIGMIWV